MFKVFIIQKNVLGILKCEKNIIMSLVDVCVFFFFFSSDYYTIKNAILFKEGEKEIKKKRRENDR